MKWFFLSSGFVKKRMLWVHFKMAISPSLCWKHGRFFSDLCENMIGLQVVKLREVLGVSLRLPFYWTLKSHTFPYWSSRNSQIIILRFLTPVLSPVRVCAPAPLRCDTLSLQIWGSSLSCDLRYLMNLRIVDFQFVQVFLIVIIVVSTFKAPLHNWLETRKSSQTVFL